MGTIYIENRHTSEIEVEVRDPSLYRGVWREWEYRDPVTAERVKVRYGHNPELKTGEGLEVFMDKGKRLEVTFCRST